VASIKQPHGTAKGLSVVGRGFRTRSLLDKHKHPFLPNYDSTPKARMLREIGVSSIEKLYSDIPREIRVKRPLKIEGLPSEQEVHSHITNILAKNQSSNDQAIFLGAGQYNHYIPAAVKAIVGRAEFQTSYTPYQAEVSQGLLQALFEFQSIVADLTEMDVVNSSLYDGATALGEAARMAARTNGRRKILIPQNLHPDKLAVLRNYTEPAGIRLETFDYDRETGGISADDVKSKLDTETSAVYAETPSFFGVLDPWVTDLPDACHEKQALAIIGFDPIALGGIKPPGEYGADIVVGEGQSISTEMNFGGPSLGIIGCRGDPLVRQMPGRLIGLTSTIETQDRAFSMVLQTREQHIRREKATSNICTNEALLAVGAASYLALLGPAGLNQLFQTILTKTQYAIKRLSENSKLTVPRFAYPSYQEFVMTFKGKRGSATEIQRKLLARGVQPGKNLSKDFFELGESILTCVTELHSTDDIDSLASNILELKWSE